MNSTLVIHQLNLLYRQYFITDRPAQQFHPQGNSFRDTLIQSVHNQYLKGTLFKENGEIDLEWYMFLYWVFTEDKARINDALHGYLWVLDPFNFGKCVPLNPKGSLAKVLNTRPIVQIERSKEASFAELITFARTKFNTTPNVTYLGYENIPLRHYGLRDANVTMLCDSMQTHPLPKNQLFPNPNKQINYREASRCDAAYVGPNSHPELYRNQHVYIVDGHNMNVDSTYMIWEMIHAMDNLTKHGYFAFDVPLYNFRMIDKIRPIMRPVLSEYYRDNGLLTLYGDTDNVIAEVIKVISEANSYLAFHDINRFYTIDQMELVRHDAYRKPVAIRVRLEAQ